MSSASGKPLNPLDLSAYVSQKAREQANAERYPAAADDPFRSPYAPKRTDERGGTQTHPVENDPERARSPYAPRNAQVRPVAQPDDLAARDGEEPFLRPPEGMRAPEGLRTPEGLRGHSAPERLDLDFDESQRSAYDAPAGARAPARPHSNVPGGPDLSPHMAFEEVAKEHPVDLDAAASLQPAHPSSEPRDEVMNDRELDRLEASLRWLQRQEATTRLPRGEPLAPVRGLPPPADARDRHPPADARERHPRGDTRERGDVHALRSPLSLEPARMAPPPRGSRHDSLRWPLRILIASSVAAPVLYYLSVGWGPAPEPLRIATSTPSTSVIPPTIAPSSAPRSQRELLPGRAQDDAPATLAARGEFQPQPPASQQPTIQPPQPARVPERAPAARSQSAPPAVAAPSPARPPARTLGSDDIALLIKQGEQFIASGDVVTARIVFLRAAEAGDPNAAVALGATYDPTVLARLGVVGMAADVEKARSWYQKAESLGSPEASRRLKILANR